jgi:hypothetical protein
MARKNEEGDDLDFLVEAVGSLSRPGLKLPVLLAAVLLPATNILLLSTLPTHANPDHGPYVAALGALLVCYAALVLAMTRILNGSPRPAWSPDWSALVYGLVVLVSFFIGLFADWILDPTTSTLTALANRIVSSTIAAPLTPWCVAIAVERPLAWRPAPWIRRFRAWLPALLLWNFLILVPADILYRIGFAAWVDKVGPPNWLFFILDGVTTAARLSLGVALASVAYRRVARL